MISSLVLVQLGLVAAAPITISSVEAVRDGGRLAITINGDAMIDPEAASAKMADGRLYLYVHDARVREANRAWGEGASEIRAHRHRHEVELVVPLGDGACTGSVELDKAPQGLRAYVGCEGRVPARGAAATKARAAAAAARPEPQPKAGGAKAEVAKTEVAKAEVVRAEVVKVEVVKAAKAEVAKVEAPVVEAPVRPAARPATRVVPSTGIDRNVQDAVALKAALVLQPPVKVSEKPAEPPVPPAGRASPAKAGTATGPSGAAALTTTSVAPELAAGGVAPIGEPRAAGASADSVASPSGKSAGGGMLVAGVLLAALAFAAFHFTRRRARSSRYIQIVESASLGPKRSIVVARVGDATMVLGTSEAGITLLKALPLPGAELHAAAASPAAARAPSGSIVAPAAVPARPVEETRSASGPVAVAAAEADDDVPVDDLGFDDPTPGGDHQGAGLIARFFRRGDAAANGAGDASFADLLEDSLEDQELRRKLSLGLAGRTR